MQSHFSPRIGSIERPATVRQDMTAESRNRKESTNLKHAKEPARHFYVLPRETPDTTANEDAECRQKSYASGVSFGEGMVRLTGIETVRAGERGSRTKRPSNTPARKGRTNSSLLSSAGKADPSTW